MTTVATTSPSEGQSWTLSRFGLYQFCLRVGQPTASAVMTAIVNVYAPLTVLYALLSVTFEVLVDHRHSCKVGPAYQGLYPFSREVLTCGPELDEAIRLLGHMGSRTFTAQVDACLMLLVFVAHVLGLCGFVARYKTVLNDSLFKVVCGTLEVCILMQHYLIEPRARPLVLLALLTILNYYLVGYNGLPAPVKAQQSETSVLEYVGAYTVYWDNSRKRHVVTSHVANIDRTLPKWEGASAYSQEMAIPDSKTFKYVGKKDPHILTFLDEGRHIIGHGCIVEINKKLFVATAAHVYQHASFVCGADPSKAVNWPLDKNVGKGEHTEYINSVDDYYLQHVTPGFGSSMGIGALHMAIPSKYDPIYVYHSKYGQDTFKNLEWQWSRGGIDWGGKYGALHTASTTPGYSGTPIIVKHGDVMKMVGIHLGYSDSTPHARNRFAPLGLIELAKKKCRIPGVIQNTQESYFSEDSDTGSMSDEELDGFAEDKYSIFEYEGNHYAVFEGSAHEVRGSRRDLSDGGRRDSFDREQDNPTNESAKGKAMGRLEPAARKETGQKQSAGIGGAQPSGLSDQQKAQPAKTAKPAAKTPPVVIQAVKTPATATPKDQPKASPKTKAKANASMEINTPPNIQASTAITPHGTHIQPDPLTTTKTVSPQTKTTGPPPCTGSQSSQSPPSPAPMKTGLSTEQQLQVLSRTIGALAAALRLLQDGGTAGASKSAQNRRKKQKK